jgi:hypothetical protein
MMTPGWAGDPSQNRRPRDHRATPPQKLTRAKQVLFLETAKT